MDYPSFVHDCTVQQASNKSGLGMGTKRRCGARECFDSIPLGSIKHEGPAASVSTIRPKEQEKARVE